MADTVNKNGSGTRVFDVKYTMDSLNRLTKAEEGTFSGSISNRSRQQLWTLDQVGNQGRDKVDLNGDNDFVDSGEIDDTRTYNDPNELLTRDTDSNSSVNYTLTYNKRGDMTDDGKDYTYVYDAFGRLKTVKTRGGSPVTVAEYTYDGLGHRIGWHYDTDTDADVDASDRWYWFAHDDRWRIVATFRGTGASSTDTSPKEQFVFHAGGLNGTGGSSYIDSVILREKDDNSGWTSSADGTLELRRYYLQNWRADVSAMVEADGTQVERVKYSAYGVPIDLTPGDFNADASITSQDDTDFNSASGGSYDVRVDLNMDGIMDFSDYLAFLNEYGSGEAGGRGVLSRSSNANRNGYAGYQHASELMGTKWHVRHRVMDSDLGKWIRRDPIGYIGGPSLTAYLNSRPIVAFDPFGLLSLPCPSGTCGHDQIGPPRSPWDQLECMLDCAKCLGSIVGLGLGCGSGELTWWCLFQLIKGGLSIPACDRCLDCLSPLERRPPGRDPGDPDPGDLDPPPGNTCEVKCEREADWWRENVCRKCPAITRGTCKKDADLGQLDCIRRCENQVEDAVEMFVCKMCARARRSNCNVPPVCDEAQYDECTDPFCLPNWAEPGALMQRCQPWGGDIAGS